MVQVTWHETFAAQRREHLERSEHVEQFETGIEDDAQRERSRNSGVVHFVYPFNSLRVTGKIDAGRQSNFIVESPMHTPYPELNGRAQDRSETRLSRGALSRVNGRPCCA